MTYENAGTRKLLLLSERGNRGAMTALLLMSATWNTAPLCFKHESLEALIKIGLIAFDDRDDGRWYMPTESGLQARAVLADMMGMSTNE